jgi:hypothetical protein
MEMPPGAPYADYDHYREEMVAEWIAGSDAIPADQIAAWVVELAQRPRQRGPVAPVAPASEPREEALALSYPEAARLLGYSVDHFERHVVPDGLRIVVKGRRKTVPRTELVRWLEQNAARALRGL